MLARWIRRSLAPIRELRPAWRRKTLPKDATAGVVLGVESVPDGLASALLAGVNPVSGLYAYLFGMVGGALFTSASFMAVQATGAMAIVVADVDLGSRDDPSRSLFTLSIMTGFVMILAGALKLGKVLRFVSNSVMTGFITAVGINIALGRRDADRRHQPLCPRTAGAGSKLMIVTDNPRIEGQLDVTGVLGAVGADNVYLGNEWVGQTLKRARRDASEWVGRPAAPETEGDR